MFVGMYFLYPSEVLFCDDKGVKEAYDAYKASGQEHDHLRRWWLYYRNITDELGSEMVKLIRLLESEPNNQAYISKLAELRSTIDHNGHLEDMYSDAREEEWHKMVKLYDEYRKRLEENGGGS